MVSFPFQATACRPFERLYLFTIAIFFFAQSGHDLLKVAAYVMETRVTSTRIVLGIMLK